MIKIPYPKPAGDYVLVPTEPTIEMLNAYDEARKATTMVTDVPGYGRTETYNPHQSYWAMLAAVPKATQPAPQETYDTVEIGMTVTTRYFGGYERVEIKSIIPGGYVVSRFSGQGTEILPEGEIETVIGRPDTKPAAAGDD